jgi:hypothetical protein
MISSLPDRDLHPVHVRRKPALGPASPFLTPSEQTPHLPDPSGTAADV